MKRRERLGYDSKQIKQKKRKPTGRKDVMPPQVGTKRGDFYGKKWYPEQALVKHSK